MVQETHLHVKDLIYPIFLQDGSQQKIEIASMPGIYRYSPDTALQEIEECIHLGIHQFILFPAVAEQHKDSYANYSHNKENFYLQTIQRIKQNFPQICLISDVAMDPYNSDGHDGLVKNGEIVNDETLPILAKMALAQAEAGIDIIGPSDMMDGRIEYLRRELDDHGYQKTSIMSYTAKYASAFYGPFRDALDSAPKSGDKKTYQMDPANSREALLEAELDSREGADFLMIKPALSYLDIISKIRNHSHLPIVAYNVSGEYAMICAAYQNGWLDRDSIMQEILLSIKRAGADMIITYYARMYAELQAP